MERLSLRARLLLGVVLLTGVGLVAADVATYSSLRSYIYGRVNSTLNAIHPDIDHGERPPAGYCVQVRSLSERVLFSGCAPAPGDQRAPASPRYPKTISLPSQPSGGAGDRVRFLTVGAIGDEERYRVRASIEGDDPHALLLLASPLDAEDSTMHRLLLIELIATAAVLGALAAASLWIVRLGLRPLREIELTAAAITAGDLSHRVDHPDPRTEVGRVGSALNVMLDRIEASDRRLRRFVADASHELRTPLAAVRAYAELFGRGASTRPEDLERSLGGITREAERMSLLVEDLLLLARLDEGRPLERQEVALDRVAREAADAAHVLDPERPLELEVEPATVTGDADRLRQVVDNLLSNVRSHTPPGSPVRVALRREGGRAVLSVTDSGPGMSEEQAERVFERFWRSDESRSRASGGAGLGLSIVAAVAAAHGGKASAHSAPGEGATFVVELPLAASHSTLSDG